MPNSEVTILQARLKEKLNIHFDEVISEWPAMSGERNIYSPRTDIAVGPYATREPLIAEYDRLMESKRFLFEQLIEFHLENAREFDDRISPVSFNALKERNRNARCLIAIEIDNKVSRKHLMGSIVNAVALGRVGIVITWNADMLNASFYLRNYLRFLDEARKPTFDTSSLLILNRSQTADLLNILS